MNQIKKLVIGTTTESVLRLLFDLRVANESSDPDFNSASRALRIQDLKAQVLGFIKRNPNGTFIVISPEYKSEKVLTLKFDNFILDEDEEENDNTYEIVINENFVEAEITHKVLVGKDIVLKIKAK
jgi:hypothetical protein